MRVTSPLRRCPFLVDLVEKWRALVYPVQSTTRAIRTPMVPWSFSLGLAEPKRSLERKSSATERAAL